MYLRQTRMRTFDEIHDFQATTLDDNPPGFRLIARFRTFAEIAGWTVMVASVAACAGLIAGIPQAKTALVSQGFSLAVGASLASAGLSLALQGSLTTRRWERWLAKIAALAVVIHAGWSLINHMRQPAGELPTSSWPYDMAMPGPYPEILALSLLTVGVSLLLILRPPISLRQRTGTLLHWGSGAATLLALVGYSCTLAGGLGLSPALSLALTVMYLGIIFGQPERGPFSVIVAENIGGMVARRLFFSVLGVPLVLGYLNLAMESAHFYEPALGSSILAGSIIVVLTTVIVYTSESLQRLYRQAMVSGTVRRQQEQRLTIQYILARVLAESSSIEEAGPKILQTACQAVGWLTGSLWLVDKETNRLQLSSFWHLPDLDVHDFERATREAHFERNIGLPGKVWASAEALSIMTAVDDVNFPRAREALKYGLHAGFGIPILLDNEVIGVIEFFAREPRELDESMLELFTTFGVQFGQFIQRKLAEQALRASQELTRQIIEKAIDPFIAIDQDGKVTDWNTQAEKTFGWSRAEAMGRTLAELIIPPSRSESREESLEAFRTTRGGILLHQRKELTVIDKSGREFPAEIAFIPISSAESPTLCAFLRDISDRKRQEEMI